MDTDVQAQFDKIDGQLEQFEKRFSDIKTPLTWSTTLLVVIFGMVSGLGYLNLSRERDETEKLRIQVKEDTQTLRSEVQSELGKEKNKVDVALGKLGEPPHLKLLGKDGQPIAGQTVDAKIRLLSKSSNQDRITFSLLLFNSGGRKTDELLIQAFTNSPIFSPTNSPLTKYEYRWDWGPKKWIIERLPKRASVWFELGMPLPRNNRHEIVKKPNHPIRLQVFYGGDGPAIVDFTLRVTE